MTSKRERMGHLCHMLFYCFSGISFHSFSRAWMISARRISVESPFNVLSDETLHQFVPMGLQVSPQGLDYQAVDIWKPTRLYLFLGLLGQA
jgi:hypothetical protein